MKKRGYIIAVFLLTAGMVFLNLYSKQRDIELAYNYGITLLTNGSYEGALGEFEKANRDKINRDDFLSDVRNDEIEEPFKNTIPLYAYTLAQMEYNEEDMDVPAIREYLELISEEYDGEMVDSIKKFKENFSVIYDMYLAEEERMEEARRIEANKREEEKRLSYKDKIPYEGMEEDYINYTSMGKYHDYEHIVVGKGKRNEYSRDEYRWKNDDGKTILYVECRDGVVTDVRKYWEDKYWTTDGKPIFSGRRSENTSGSGGKKKVYNDDSYNVNDYYDAEDFYDDYYDDFYEYEEAEEYFEENREW